jgi:transposase
MPRINPRLSTSEVDFIMKMREVKYSNREIARRMKITEGAVRYQQKRQLSPAVDKRKLKESVLAPYTAFIRQWMSNYLEDSRRPTTKLLHHVLRTEFGLELSYDALRRFLAKRFPEFHKKPTWVRVQTPPGSMMFVDWKEDISVQMGRAGNWTKVHALVFSLGFSGKIAVIFFTSKDLESFISGHQQAFRKLGGLPQIIRPDCLKSAVKKWKGQHSELNFRYESYLKRLGVFVFPSRPGTPTDKGQVEKRIRDFFGSIDFRHRIFTDMKDLQSCGDQEQDRLDRTWRSSSTGMLVCNTFAFEQDHLKPLPKDFPLLPVYESYVDVRPDCSVPFAGNTYQVERKYARCKVLCINTGAEIEIYYQGEEIGRFPYLPLSKGMLMLSQKALSDPDIHLSETVRKWGLEVAARQVDYYQQIVSHGGVQ